MRWADRRKCSEIHAKPNQCKVKQIEAVSHGIDKQTLSKKQHEIYIHIPNCIKVYIAQV